MTRTGLICSECTENDDPRSWCDCQDDEQCIGPCRKRAHHPDRCPFRSAYVPHPVPARLVRAGDVVRQRDGQLVMVQWSSQEDGHDAAPGHRKILVQFGIYAANALEVPADYPVPVLVPYAERAAELVLRENDRARGHRSQTIERTGR
jgi:hypothetical protein